MSRVLIALLITPLVVVPLTGLMQVAAAASRVRS